MHMLKNKGFTLIELMVVIVIIGILATLAIPKFNEASLKAKVAEAPTVLSTYENAQLAYLAETATLGVVSDLVMQDPTGATFSKYYTYTTAAGQCIGTGAAAGMGSVIGKTVDVIVYTTQSSAKRKDAAFDKYLPNWN
jgi:prepilin-type N-terminal cleavage/methylation domain-containing protein